jgi:hypothetical protein
LRLLVLRQVLCQEQLVLQDLVELDLIVGRHIPYEGPVLRDQHREEIAETGQTDVAELGDRNQQKVAGLSERAR